MRIAVNTRFLLPILEGFGWFTLECFLRIVRKHSQHTFIFIFDRKTDVSQYHLPQNVETVVAYPQARHPILFYIWFEYTIPKVLKRVNADIFISPDGFCSLSTPIKQVLVIHDLYFEHNPSAFPLLYRWYFRYFTPKYIKQAQHIFTVSNYTKQDIIKTYHTPTHKISVGYNGASEDYKPVDGATKHTTQNTYTNGKPFFVTVGAVSERKNIHTLLLAFDKLQDKHPNNHKLVVIGRDLWKKQTLAKTRNHLKHADAFIFLDYVKKQDLATIVASAEALIYPSLFEGFGIPLVEAMQCHIPIISSNTSVMPEVVGKDNGLFFDPTRTEDIIQTIQYFIENTSVQKTLQKQSKIRSKDFSWDITADALWQTIEKTF